MIILHFCSIDVQKINFLATWLNKSDLFEEIRSITPLIKRNRATSLEKKIKIHFSTFISGIPWHGCSKVSKECCFEASSLTDYWTQLQRLTPFFK